MKRFMCIAAVVILLLAIAIPLRLFFIGEPLDAAQVYYTVTDNGDNLRLNFATSGSAIAFRGWKYHQEGNALYISARKVLVSRFFPSGVYGTIITPDVLTQIYFGGDLIWSAE